MDDYLGAIFKLPINNLLSLLLLTILRIIPIVVTAPFLGGKLLPSATKIGFSIFIALLLFPFLIPLDAKDLLLGFPIVALGLKELFIGIIIGLLVSIPFNIATSAGSIIDHQRGSSSLQITDPSSTVQTSPIGMFMNEILLVSFFLIGGMHYFFETLIQFFKRIPPEAFIAPSSFTMNSFWHTIIELMATLFALAVRFAAPPLIAMLMADFFLGIANRLAPQVQIAFLGMPLKSLLGIALLFIGFNFIMMHMEKETMLWFKKIYQIFQVFPIKASG